MALPLQGQYILAGGAGSIRLNYRIFPKKIGDFISLPRMAM